MTGRYTAGGVVLALALIAGCNSSASVSGNVTYEGQPVKEGHIEFQPADGKGPGAGGKITNGSYQVDKLTPGPKVVKIVAVKEGTVPRSSEEMAKLAAEAKAKGKIVEPADLIPEDAIGNNAKVEVIAGAQTHNFTLKRPEKK